MGPECPLCGWVYEWCEREMAEHIHFPQTYFCQGCSVPFTLEIDEVEAVQSKCNDYLSKSTPSETEEDWKKLRGDWDKGDLR